MGDGKEGRVHSLNPGFPDWWPGRSWVAKDAAIETVGDHSAGSTRGWGAGGVATPILERLLRDSHVLTITGESYRLREKRHAGVLDLHVALCTGGDMRGNPIAKIVGLGLSILRLPAPRKSGVFNPHRQTVGERS